MWNPFSRTASALRTPFGSNRPWSDSAFRPPSIDGSPASDIAHLDVIDRIAVVTLTVDELSGNNGASALADLLDRVVESQPDHIVLDIQNVLFMDSSCVGCMVEALNRLSASGGRIALVNPGSSVSHIFRITRLDRVFPICSDVVAAMKAVRRGNQSGSV